MFIGAGREHGCLWQDGTMWDLGSLVSADPSMTEADTVHASTHDRKVPTRHTEARRISTAVMAVCHDRSS